MFKITFGKGFHIQFSNGYIVSVQFGAGNYCENRYDSLDHYDDASRKASATCQNAEVAVWRTGGEWYRPSCLNAGDDVAGYVTPDQLAQVIAEVQARPSISGVPLLNGFVSKSMVVTATRIGVGPSDCDIGHIVTN